MKNIYYAIIARFPILLDPSIQFAIMMVIMRIVTI